MCEFIFARAREAVRGHREYAIRIDFQRTILAASVSSQRSIYSILFCSIASDDIQFYRKVFSPSIGNAEVQFPTILSIPAAATSLIAEAKEKRS